MLRYLRRRRRSAAGDEGFAMVTVLGAMFVLTVFAVVALTVATQNLPVARRVQDYNAAMAAAQAGVDDYLRHLNDNDTYWTLGNSDSTNPALTTTGWASIPGTSSGGIEQFRYQVLDSVATMTANKVIRLKVTGRANNVKRTIETDLRKSGFLKYIYFTDKETLDPSFFNYSQYPAGGGNSNQKNAQGYYYWHPAAFDQATMTQYCGTWHYATATTPARTSAPWAEQLRTQPSGGGTLKGTTAEQIPCIEINFITGDAIHGPIHSNDAFTLNGAPLFDSPTTESSWADGSTPAPNPNARYVASVAGSAPSSSGYPIKYAPPLTMPPSNSSVKSQTNASSGGTGCLYTGPTRIVMLSTGKMSVLSPYTHTTNPGCGTGLFGATTAQPVNLPPNGVVYVQSIPASSSDPNYTNISACPSQELGTYPQSGDITPYDCRAGDAFVEGTLSGALTIATENNIVVTGPTKYASGTSGSDVLGLVANNYVQIYHPVNSSGANLAVKHLDGTSSVLSGIEVDAAILSVNHSFIVQNYNVGSALSSCSNVTTDLKIVGAIAQEYRGPVGTGSCSGSGIATGYVKNYNYDSRLQILPPPFFLDPTSAPWGVSTYSEQQSS